MAEDRGEGGSSNFLQILLREAEDSGSDGGVVGAVCHNNIGRTAMQRDTSEALRPKGLSCENECESFRAVWDEERDGCFSTDLDMSAGSYNAGFHWNITDQN